MIEPWMLALWGVGNFAAGLFLGARFVVKRMSPVVDELLQQLRGIK